MDDLRISRSRHPSPARDAFIVAIAILLVALPLGRAFADVSPSDELRRTFSAANRILNDPDTEGRPIERLQTILGVVSDVFAFREAAEAALGHEWDRRSASERDEFTRLFANLLERSFVYTLAARAKLDGGVEIGPLHESLDGHVAKVASTVTTRDGSKVAVDYDMIRRDDHWMIRDVTIEGMSVIASYRAQIARVMQSASFESLVSRMRDRLSAEAIVPAAEVDVLGRAPSVVFKDAATTGSRDVPSVRVETTFETVVLPPPASVARTPRAEPRVVASAPAVPVAVVAATKDGRATQKGDEATRVVDARVAPAPSPVTVRELRATPRASTPAPRASVAMTSPSVTPPSSESASPRYWVQVGAFRDRATARNLGERLRGQRLPVSVEESAAGDPVSLARVRVGPFAYRATAVATLHQLEAQGFKPFLRPAP